MSEQLKASLWLVLPFVLLAVPAMTYLGQAAFYWLRQHRVGMAIAFVGYTIGNIGFMIDLVEQGLPKETA